MSKTLKSTYANRAGQAHVVLADRMKERDPGSAPNINDRVPFVYIVTKQPRDRKGRKVKVLQGDKIEAPQYVLDNNLEIDLLHYITNQVMKPSISYLELIAKDPKKIFIDYVNKELNRRSGKKSIMDYVDLDSDDDSSNSSSSSSSSSSDDSDNNNEEQDSNDSRIVKDIKEKKKKSFVFKI